MAEDGITGLAKLFKERNPTAAPSIMTGVVVSPLPRPQIRWGEVVMLQADQLIFA